MDRSTAERAPIAPGSRNFNATGRPSSVYLLTLGIGLAQMPANAGWFRPKPATWRECTASGSKRLHELTRVSYLNATCGYGVFLSVLLHDIRHGCLWRV